MLAHAKYRHPEAPSGLPAAVTRHGVSHRAPLSVIAVAHRSAARALVAKALENECHAWDNVPVPAPILNAIAADIAGSAAECELLGRAPPGWGTREAAARAAGLLPWMIRLVNARALHTLRDHRAGIERAANALLQYGRLTANEIGVNRKSGPPIAVQAALETPARSRSHDSVRSRPDC